MFNRSLGFKIILFVVVIFAVFAYVSYKAGERQMLTHLKRMADLLTRSIYGGLNEAMIEGKTQKVQKMIEGYGSVEDIDRIRIFDPEDGTILVDADKANVGNTIDQRYIHLITRDNNHSEAVLFFKDNRRILSVVTPIMNGPKCYQCHDPREQILGALDVDMVITDAVADIARTRFLVMQFALLAIIGTSLVITLFFFYLFNRPVKKLVNTMNMVESGDLTAEVHISDSSELGKLGRSLNSMTAKLRADIERLEALHKTAENLRSTMAPGEIERITIQGIAQGLGFDRVVLLSVNQEEQTLEGRISIGLEQDIVEHVRVPLRREYGVLAETVLDSKPFNVQKGIHDLSMAPEKELKCWEYSKCSKVDCPAYCSDDLRCWMLSKTHCQGIIQLSLADKAEACCHCPVIQEAYGKKATLVMLMFGSEAFATVPLKAQDKVTGVIMVDNLYSDRKITDEDIKGLSIFAAQSGMAIENAKLYKKLESGIEIANEELKQKIKALTEMQNFNYSILENMSNGLITVDEEGNIIYFNSAAEAILGYQWQIIQGYPLKDLFNDLDILAFKTLQENKGFAFHESKITKKAGATIPIEVSTSLLKNDADETIGVVLIFSDLTERKEMELQIRRADKLATLGQLAAGVAHEIRNPLAGISGVVQILRDDISDNDPSREILDEIVEKIKILNASINNFLRFARPAPLQYSPVNINEVIQSVLFLINKQADIQKVSILEEYDDNLPIIMADSEQLQQVILNIALNALQAIGEDGGKILFKTFRNSDMDRIIIEISDTGVGIPAEKLDQIFTPYYTTKSEGTGLGLSIAQRIIEEHGGHISVESYDDRGTTFRVSLKYV